MGAAFLYFTLPDSSCFTVTCKELYEYISPLTMRFIGILAGLNAVLIILLFRQKKWAYYTLWGVAVINFALNLSMGFGVGLAVGGLAVPAILSVIVLPKWSLFK